MVTDPLNACWFYIILLYIGKLKEDKSLVPPGDDFIHSMWVLIVKTNVVLLSGISWYVSQIPIQVDSVYIPRITSSNFRYDVFAAKTVLHTILRTHHSVSIVL